ncbi:MAG TPA: hypothetical protein VE617_07335, partial [Propionibacteriaceae bacterium]|nr:hypothetical protein [Propionibacteriaceae bacterium]
GPRAAQAGLPPAPSGAGTSTDLPLPIRLLTRFPVLQGIPARVVAIGPRPEHAPRWARRPSRIR